jgi:pilus assembly protein CpaF
MSDEQPAETLPVETRAAIERMKRWLTEPGTTLLGSSALPRIPSGVPFSPASSDGKTPALSTIQPPRRHTQTKPTPAMPVPPERQQQLQELAVKLAEQITAEGEPLAGTRPFAADQSEQRQMVRTRAQALLQGGSVFSSHVWGPEEANLLFELVEQEVLGYGPLSPLMTEQAVTEILVLGPSRVFVERASTVQETQVRFQHAAHLLRIIHTLLHLMGRTMTPGSSIEEGRLPDGTQVQILLPPSAVNGPILALRKLTAHHGWQMEELIDRGMLSPAMAALLYGAVLARLNIVIAGGAGSGKTTLLNTLSSFIPAHERIVVIEETNELQLNQRQVVTLKARSVGDYKAGRDTVGEMVQQALRLRPRRLLMGECRGGEMFELLQALNSGLDGVMMTIYATSPQDCLLRLETQAMLAGSTVSVLALRRQIANVVHLIVHLARLRDGSCKVMQITEVQRSDDETIHLQEVYRFKEAENTSATNRAQGSFEPSGIMPLCYSKLEQVGVHLPKLAFVKDQHRQTERWEALPWE